MILFQSNWRIWDLIFNNLQLEFHVHHAKEAAKVVKITSLLDPKTGKATKRAPRCLVAKQTAILEVSRTSMLFCLS